MLEKYFKDDLDNLVLDINTLKKHFNILYEQLKHLNENKIRLFEIMMNNSNLFYENNILKIILSYHHENKTEKIDFKKYKNELINKYIDFWNNLKKMGINESILSIFFKQMYEYLETYLNKQMYGHNISLTTYSTDESLVYNYEDDNSVLNNLNNFHENFTNEEPDKRKILSYIRLDNIGSYKFRYNDLHIFSRLD